MQETVLSGRYKIVAEMGRGAFGQTYLAEDSHLPDRPKCVVKQLKPQNTDPATLQTASRLFNSEAQVLQKLGNYDRIPRLFAYLEENQEFYLVQELIEGNPLSEEIKPGQRLSEAEVIEFLREVLSILEYVHGQNVIHRDIKPSNIIRRASDRKLILIDFGAVKQISNQKENTAGESNLTVAVSTYGYTPPEQMRGQPRYSSDLYAVGMTAIQALTGVHPSQLRRDDTTNEILWRSLVQVSEPLALLLDKMTRDNLAERYQSAAQVLADLEKVQQVLNAPTLLSNPSQTGLPATVAENREATGLPATAIENSRPTNLPPTQAETHAENSQKTGFSKTQAKNSRATAVQNSAAPPLRRRSLKPWQILAAVAATGALVGLVEIFQPIFRPLYYLRQGEQFLEADRPEEALVSFQTITNNIKPNDAQAWKGQGDALYSLDRYEKSLAAYEKALQYQPNDAETLNKKGRVLYGLEDYSGALSAHEQALKIAPNDGQGWYGKGIALIGLKRYEEALAAFDKARKIQPQNPKGWQSKGLALEYLGRREEAFKVYEEAIAAYDDVLKANPKKLHAWVDRGSVLSKLQRQEQALESYNNALEIDPNFYPALVAKGNALFFLGRPDEALAALDKAVEVRPKSYLAWHNRGSLLANGLNKFEEAIQSFDKALEIRPSFYNAWRDRGAALDGLNKYSEAISSFDQALKINPNDHKSWASKGITLSGMGRNEEAVAALDKAKSIEPNDPFVWFYRGQALENLQQNDEALKSYDKAIEIRPDFQPAFEARRQLRQKLGR